MAPATEPGHQPQPRTGDHRPPAAEHTLKGVVVVIACKRCKDTDGPHSYRGNNGWRCEGCLPWKRARARKFLLFVIRIEGGEWTVGRVKALYRKALPTHILRTTIRRDLKDLARDGHLVQHDDPARRFYTFNWERP